MNILVFVTDDGTEAGSGPVLFLKEFATSSMPANPRGLEWKYFATVNEGDSCWARIETRSNSLSNRMSRSLRSACYGGCRAASPGLTALVLPPAGVSSLRYIADE